ncbi:sulfotransferase family 2 domain-containing protein [uncultured Shimia sp.]|uniref:sulfotransferase family 2 domain-containing protein n=1 Tax=uncultured Shimia sp. TaxID=573152 RepID=UPI00261DA237|nr:sulfotransferase family 2 domain-containing protein [uncultured Shimia sp.]
MSHESKFSSDWPEPRFTYLEFAKTRSSFLSPELIDFLGPKCVHFNPAHQGKFVDTVTVKNWSVLWGRFSAAHTPVRDLLTKCNRFTVVQNPVDRFVSSYLEVCASPKHPLYQVFSERSLIEACHWAVQNQIDVGRSSQTSGIVSSCKGVPEQQDTIFEFCKKNLSFCGTVEQLPQLLSFLKTAELVAPNLPEIKPADVPFIEASERDDLAKILRPAAKNDFGLFQDLKKNGPIINAIEAPDAPYMQALKDTRSRCLVYGFSVTADTPGYVEEWQKTFAKNFPDLRLDKAGIGGLQPHHARHLVRDLLDRWQPDHLIVEISTAISRLQPDTKERRADHAATIESLLGVCQERGISIGFLDLPQTGVVPQNDWMFRVHKEICDRYKVPRVIVDLQKENLKDNVHPTASGKAVYAQALNHLLSEVLVHTPKALPAGKKLPIFDCYAVADVVSDCGVRQMFSRNGFSTEMVRIREGETVTFQLSQAQEVCGLIVSMGPTTSVLNVCLDKQEEVVDCFDIHCYYFRVAGRSVKPEVTDSISISQPSQLPKVAPDKGTVNNGARIGGITHFLFKATP